MNIPTKDQLVQGLINDAQRVKSIATSALADKIWQNPVLVNGANVIRGILGDKPKQPTPKPTPLNVPYNVLDIRDAIGKHETHVLQKADKTYYAPKSVDETYSYKNPVNGALGHYQVEPDTLKGNAKRYIGQDVTPQQFLASKDMQDKFALSMLEDRAERFSLTQEELIKSWNRGLNGDWSSKEANKYHKDVRVYLPPEKK